jgi:hypothetical protein
VQQLAGMVGHVVVAADLFDVSANSSDKQKATLGGFLTTSYERRLAHEYQMTFFFRQ